MYPKCLAVKTPYILNALHFVKGGLPVKNKYNSLWKRPWVLGKSQKWQSRNSILTWWKQKNLLVADHVLLCQLLLNERNSNWGEEILWLVLNLPRTRVLSTIVVALGPSFKRFRKWGIFRLFLTIIEISTFLAEAWAELDIRHTVVSFLAYSLFDDADRRRYGWDVDCSESLLLTGLNGIVNSRITPSPLVLHRFQLENKSLRHRFTIVIYKYTEDRKSLLRMTTNKTCAYIPTNSWLHICDRLSSRGIDFQKSRSLKQL